MWSTGDSSLLKIWSNSIGNMSVSNFLWETLSKQSRRQGWTHKVVPIIFTHTHTLRHTAMYMCSNTHTHTKQIKKKNLKCVAQCPDVLCHFLCELVVLAPFRIGCVFVSLTSSPGEEEEASSDAPSPLLSHFIF